MPPPGYLQGVRELCTRHGIVLIADEVMAGFGRTGKWFAVEHFDVVPDLLTFAKGVNSGYVPLGGVAISPEIAATFGQAGLPGRTDLLRPSARDRGGRGHDQRHGGRADRGARCLPRGHCDRPGAGGFRAKATSRSAKSAAPASSGRSNWSRTARRANRWLPMAAPVRR